MKKGYILTIDTRRSGMVRVAITATSGAIVTKEVTGTGSQEVALLISDLLSEQGIDLSGISAIQFSEGPGSFTGLRVGAGVANCLSWLLGLSINNRPVGRYISPTYDASRFDV